jgi:hypothetical protein
LQPVCWWTGSFLQNEQVTSKEPQQNFLGDKDFTICKTTRFLV